MRVLGSLIFVWGAGLTMAAVVNYWIWFSLRGASIQTLSSTDRAFVEGYGHGFFILISFVGVAVAFGGVKLIGRKRAKSTSGQ